MSDPDAWHTHTEIIIIWPLFYSMRCETFYILTYFFFVVCFTYIIFIIFSNEKNGFGPQASNCFVAVFFFLLLSPAFDGRWRRNAAAGQQGSKNKINPDCNSVLMLLFCIAEDIVKIAPAAVALDYGHRHMSIFLLAFSLSPGRCCSYFVLLLFFVLASTV